MLKSFVEIKFEICSIYKAQCAEESSPLKFTELFQKMRDISATRGLEVALQNSSVKSLSRSYRCAPYWKYARDLEHANDANCAISTFENTGVKYTCRIISSWNFPELSNRPRYPLALNYCSSVKFYKLFYVNINIYFFE